MTYIDENRLRNTVVAILVAAAVLALPLYGQVAGAESVDEDTSDNGAGSTVSVRIRAVATTITQVNNSRFDNNEQAGSVAIKTQESKNQVHFKTDNDAHVKIVLGDKVLWEGDTKAGQPVTAMIDLGTTAPGIYNIAIKAALKDNLDHPQTVYFHLDYQATIPSIIPDNNGTIYDKGGVKAPNTGMYVTMGGRVYSMSTVSLVLLLMAVAVFLICTKGRKETAKATVKAKTAKTKTTRKKMDLI